MLTGLSLGHIINYFREKWQTLPDMRNQDNNNLTYPIVDGGIGVNWVELKITHEETGEQIYKNSFAVGMSY